jgi:hypothetical protein
MMAMMTLSLGKEKREEERVEMQNIASPLRQHLDIPQFETKRKESN